jgi:hypothetical protein
MLVGAIEIEPVQLSVPVIMAGVIFVITVAAAVSLVLLVLHLTQRELDVGLKPLRFGTHPRTTIVDRTTEELLETALARLEDLEQGLAALVEAPEAELERRGQNWLDYVCEGLATVLAAGTHHRYRVAIWSDDEDDRDFLKGLAYHGFDRNLPKYEKLPRATTLAGWAVSHGEEHYAPDISKCTLFRRRTHPPGYKSMVATPLGPGTNPWAVITVDAPQLDGLDVPRLALVRRFGVLATVGATIVQFRSTAVTTGTSGS